jgi:phospholipid/cholesterol/gamma-HCH transport system permease protein
MTVMFVQAVLSGMRRPLGIYDIFYQIVALGIRSMPLATLMGVFVGMALTWQFGEALMSFGAKNAVGSAAALALVRELVPTIMALTVGAKIATGMTAELGSMKVSEQIDAIASLGADPVKKLIWPRLAAATIALPLLCVYGNVLALGGGALIADTVFDVPAGYFYETYVDELYPMDYISGPGQGDDLRHAGRASSAAIRASRPSSARRRSASARPTRWWRPAVTIIIMDFVLTMIFLPVG